VRCTLLHPPRPGSTNTVPPIGLLVLAAVLEENGHEVTLLDAALTGTTGAALVRAVQGSEPEALLITAFSSDVSVLRMVLPELRLALGEVPFLLGGPHASCRGTASFDDLPEVDTIFLGEAEETLPLYLSGASNRIPGVVSRSDPWQTEPVHLDDLSLLPTPAWHHAPPKRYKGLPNGVVLKRLPFAPIITTRGCPYLCTFCAGFRITGRKIRHRPLSRVWDEIGLLVDQFGVREVHIEDDNFTFDADYAKQFCREAIARNLPVCFSTPNGVRLDSLDDELLDLMKKAGWYVVHCGIESGSDRVLRSIRKALSTSVIAERIAMIKKHGLPVAGYFIIGLPGETREDILKTISFSLSSGLDWAQFANFLPIPGSEAGGQWFDACEKPELVWSVFHNTSCPAPPSGLSAREVLGLQRKAFLRFYLRGRQLMGILGQILRPGVLPFMVRRFLAYLHLRPATVDPPSSLK
jgi:radical SAM superfamily enzyme YgiQ (UPF0313 family)